MRFQAVLWIFYWASTLADEDDSGLLPDTEDAELSSRHFFSDRPRNRCTSQRGEVGRCIPLQACPALSKKARGYQTMYVMQALSDYSCGFTRNGMQVCCPERGPSHSHPNNNPRPTDGWGRTRRPGPKKTTTESDFWNTPSTSERDSWNTPSTTERDFWNTPSTTERDFWNTPSTTERDFWNTPSSTERDSWNTPSTTERDSWNTPSNTERDSWNTPSTTERDSWNTPSTTERDSWNTPSTTERDSWNTLSTTESPFSDGFDTPASSPRTSTETAEGQKTDHRNRRLLPETTCGIELGKKIIGGTGTEIDEHPWLALLRLRRGDGRTTFHCGGSLISPRYVLTAAHCIRNPQLPPGSVVDQVRLGEWDQSKELDCQDEVCSPPPDNVEIEQRIVHPNYRTDDLSQRNDIALIRLKRPVKTSQFILPICLPLDELVGKDHEGQEMTTAGWGKTSNSPNSGSSKKLKVKLPVVSSDTCAARYRSSRMNLQNTQMCAGGKEGKDSCQGDSGGPLMSQDLVGSTVKWHIHGIVSVGPAKCGTADSPGIYTRVDKYLDWILDNMSD